jgi:hypothetical protein
VSTAPVDRRSVGFFRLRGLIGRKLCDDLTVGNNVDEHIFKQLLRKTVIKSETEIISPGYINHMCNTLDVSYEKP